MHVQNLQWKIAIANYEEAIELNRQKPHYWHVLSICGHRDKVRPDFPVSLKVLRLCFDDVEEDDPAEGIFAATLQDLRRAIQFAREIKQGSLLIH